MNKIEGVWAADHLVTAKRNMITVIGDAMIDRYWRGDVTRMSQEAPVPVVTLRAEESRAGAAGNVAMNCASLGAEVSLIAIVGDDGAADDFEKLLKDAGVKTMLVRDKGINTTQKFRIIGRNQQIARVDIDFITTTAIFPALPDGVGPVIFSDYAKGALSNIGGWIAAAARRTIIVDPKGVDFAKYRGASVVKPNIDEMRAIVGGWTSEEQLAEKARRLMADCGIAALLVTRAADGMTLFDAEGTLNIPAVAREVYDVTGAGDTVVAALAVFMERGKTLREAAVLANVAAGVVVGKFGTATVTLAELERANP